MKNAGDCLYDCLDRALNIKGSRHFLAAQGIDTSEPEGDTLVLEAFAKLSGISFCIHGIKREGDNTVGSVDMYIGCGTITIHLNHHQYLHNQGHWTLGNRITLVTDPTRSGFWVHTNCPKRLLDFEDDQVKPQVGNVISTESPSITAAEDKLTSSKESSDPPQAVAQPDKGNGLPDKVEQADKAGKDEKTSTVETVSDAEGEVSDNKPAAKEGLFQALRAKIEEILKAVAELQKPCNWDHDIRKHLEGDAITAALSVRPIVETDLGSHDCSLINRLHGMIFGNQSYDQAKARKELLGQPISDALVAVARPKIMYNTRDDVTMRMATTTVMQFLNDNNIKYDWCHEVVTNSLAVAFMVSDEEHAAREVFATDDRIAKAQDFVCGPGTKRGFVPGLDQRTSMILTVVLLSAISLASMVGDSSGWARPVAQMMSLYSKVVPAMKPIASTVVTLFRSVVLVRRTSSLCCGLFFAGLVILGKLARGALTRSSDQGRQACARSTLRRLQQQSASSIPMYLCSLNMKRCTRGTKPPVLSSTGIASLLLDLPVTSWLLKVQFTDQHTATSVIGSLPKDGTKGKEQETSLKVISNLKTPKYTWLITKRLTVAYNLSTYMLPTSYMSRWWEVVCATTIGASTTTRDLLGMAPSTNVMLDVCLAMLIPLLGIPLLIISPLSTCLALIALFIATVMTVLCLHLVMLSRPVALDLTQLSVR